MRQCLVWGGQSRAPILSSISRRCPCFADGCGVTLIDALAGCKGSIGPYWRPQRVLGAKIKNDGVVLFAIPRRTTVPT